MTNRNRDRTLYTRLRGTSNGYTGRELMERKKDGTLFLVVSEERSRIPKERWSELEGDSEEILSSWDIREPEKMIEVYIKDLPCAARPEHEERD